MSILTQSFCHPNYVSDEVSETTAVVSSSDDAPIIAVDIGDHGYHICQKCSCSWCTGQLSSSIGGANQTVANYDSPNLPPLRKIFSIKCGNGVRHEITDKLKSTSQSKISPKSQSILENLPLDHVFHLDPDVCKCTICSGYAKDGVVPVPKEWADRKFTVMDYNEEPLKHEVFEMKIFNGNTIDACTRPPFPSFRLTGHYFTVCRLCSCPTCTVLSDQSKANTADHAVISGELLRKTGAMYNTCPCMDYPKGAIKHTSPPQQIAFMSRNFDFPSARQADVYPVDHQFHLSNNCTCTLCTSLEASGVLRIPSEWYGRAFVTPVLVDTSLEGRTQEEIRAIARQQEALEIARQQVQPDIPQGYTQSLQSESFELLNYSSSHKMLDLKEIFGNFNYHPIEITDAPRRFGDGSFGSFNPSFNNCGGRSDGMSDGVSPKDTDSECTQEAVNPSQGRDSQNLSNDQAEDGAKAVKKKKQTNKKKANKKGKNRK